MAIVFKNAVAVRWIKEQRQLQQKNHCLPEQIWR